MASAAPANALPLLYNDLAPLSTQQHLDWRSRPIESLAFLKGAHAIPLTVDEFVDAQRHYPIVFSAGPNPVPLALMGLNEGVNVFVDEDGKLNSDVYLPAYIRRYPYMLARTRPDSDELSLCFDPSAGALGAFDQGDALFAEGQPSDHTKAVLGFCEQFEQAGQRTAAFMKDLLDNKLLIDGEVAIQPEGAAQPYVYRGFQMVDEQKLRDLRGDVARKLLQSGLLPLVFAHLFSLALIRNIFGRQMQAGLVPPQVQPPLQA
ncbi:multidrug transporter [Sphingomonas oleivorans]|uniref:Multidrug transporter n=1 Tax=Sphingomonas oleivorans TaxID=1735121 RepID=A0A2T5G005_9SPHN|nr:SapC family protein [Sphingomonas oleivorans]PTQ12293.1 multidrug transporter [Sphingomonas oleivorans]